MSETEQGWVEQAQYDLETARAMLASGRYLYVLFCCQQATEKALKAVIVRKTGEMPPRVHNLLRLAEVADTHPDQQQNRFLGELSAYYIQSRYPEEIKAAGAMVTRELADDVVRNTEKTVRWVLSILT
ncbi:MAG: HEPN domain-containing protein [Phycisphaerae bacterium]|nr:HEPN domain-containing protein [Phycisphaerae bacterium]